jgi:hypothetical protein
MAMLSVLHSLSTVPLKARLSWAWFQVSVLFPFRSQCFALGYTQSLVEWGRMEGQEDVPDVTTV